MKVKTRIRSTDRLTNSAFHRSGGKHRKTSYWWLRDETRFVEIPSVRGDFYFDCQLDLEPGQYVLGTGLGGDAIRQSFSVEEENDDNK